MYEAVHMLSMVRVCDIPWHMLHQTFPNNLNYCYLKNGGENIKILWFSVHQHFTGTSWPMMYERYIELSWLKLKMVNHHANIFLTISYVMKAQREKKTTQHIPCKNWLKAEPFWIEWHMTNLTRYCLLQTWIPLCKEKIERGCHDTTPDN